MFIRSPAQLGIYIQDQRKKRKLNQKDTGKLVGLKQSTISALENHPDGTRLETLYKVLAALDLELQITPKADSTHDDDWGKKW